MSNLYLYATMPETYINENQIVHFYGSKSYPKTPKPHEVDKIINRWLRMDVKGMERVASR